MVLHPFANIIPLAGVELNSSPAIDVWMQSYDPAHHWWLSTFWAALPLVVLLVAMIGLPLKGHISALIALAVALVMGLRTRAIFQVFWETVISTRFTMITIAALMALAFVTRYCGLDGTLGLAFARTGFFYPFLAR